MEGNQQNDLPPRELRNLVERIKRGNCVLVLGPRVAVQANDPSRRPLDELLASELLKDLDPLENKSYSAPLSLRRAADLYLEKELGGQVDLEMAVKDFYARQAGVTTDFHRDLAKLPFKLCISTLPDNLMLTAFKEVGKSPQKGYYHFRKPTSEPLLPTFDNPLVYYLFGDDEDPTSLVLTEDDLIQFLIAIARNTPTIPDQVRSFLTPKDASFLFLGFGFQNWYLRVLLQVLNVYGHEKAFAFEDKQFFDHPEHEQTVGFFTGKRKIDFRALRWEAFAQQLREAYEISTPRKTSESTHAHGSPPSNMPMVFLSYASEDRDAVETLAGQLETRGIRVWQDKKNLRVGDVWNPHLLHVIDKVVDYVIVVQTPMMLARIEGVFNEEITTALKRHARRGEYDGQKFRFLLPVKIGNCNSKADLKECHEIDASEPAGMASLVTAILEDWDRRMALRNKAAQVAS